ncbi:MAG: polysaccharide biosynthesis tyrosine autokinase [Elusimicrobia bacterium]|nr:polysaccharide biosynthesis tyrosine autokinase [Elusimicrobiota bacterium]
MSETESPELDIDLTHYLDILLRRRWIVAAAALLVFVTAALVTFTTPPLYQASALLVIEKERGGGAVYANGAMVENSNDDHYQTQYKLLQSFSLLQQVYQDLRLDGVKEFANPRGVEKLQTALIVYPIMRSRLVYVKVNSGNPQLAAKVANAIAETFVRQNLSNQLFISKEVLQALQIRQDSPNTRRTYEALPAVVNNTLIQTLKGEYAKLEAQAAEMSQKFTPKYPGIVAIRSNMAALKGQIDSETDKIIQSVKTDLSGQLRGNNVRVVDPARVPDRPIKPKKRLALILGLLGGLGLGLAAALIIEKLDQSLRTQEDVEKKLKLPFLGLVPYSAKKEGSIYDALLTSELSLTSESLRNLRTMIDFAGVSHASQAMIVTSTVQSEGKTYISSNLAVVFAQLGEKVLLIEGDLRRANLHKQFGLSTQRGLSDYLAASQSVEEVQESIQKTQIPNLHVLACGPRPPNPSELLNTPRLGALISWAKENFDRVIVDCTPMFPINDTLLWGRHIRSGVFVTRYGKTRVPLILKACQKLHTGGVKILGIAINSAKAGGLTYSSYGYYYQQYYHSYSQPAAASQET